MTAAAALAWRRLGRAGKPRVFTIPPDAAFVDVLAAGLTADAGPDPMALAAVTVLLPTRRAVRALREAFLRESGGKPLLLPNLTALNDAGDEDSLAFIATGHDLPPPIDPLRRQLLLTRTIMAFDKNAPPHRAAWLAAELAKLLDQVQGERLGFERLKDIVPAELQVHWQQTVEFLEILTSQWPAILAEDGALDPAEYRNRAFARQIAAWQAAGAAGPIVAAGSTGSIPATADLLLAVALLPEGCVVLPGLDRDLDEESWDALDETHPQHGMKQLLAHIGVTRDDVLPWPGTSFQPTPRRTLASEVMRPAATTERWSEIALPPDAIAGLSRVDAPSRREEAAGIALMMREALERADETCALVTPDRDLAERVAAELGRWNIVIDDSAGRSLDRTPVGTFLRLIADMLHQDFAPVALLAVCKHPLAAAGFDPADFRRLTRAVEIALLRGPRPPAGIAGLMRVAAAETASPEVFAWIKHLERCCVPFTALTPNVSFVAALEAHMQCAEALAAADDRPGASRLWSGDDGEAAASFTAELARAATALPEIGLDDYAALFGQLLQSRDVRPAYGRHPRLAILGPLEARLQRFDTIILGGLNEGTWPAAPAADPWMSRPMRKSFGLRPPERTIGLAAHDVAQMLCAPRVVLTRAEKIGGTPSVASRWLMRLDQVIATSKLQSAWNAPTAWLAWADALTIPEAVSPWPPPSPKPPVAARPRKMSVTRVEEWMRDPYGIYARTILRLKALDPIDQDPGARDFGVVLHAALQDFILERPAPDKALARLIEIGRAKFASLAPRPGVGAFWLPRFERVAQWIVAQDAALRGATKASHVEIKGGLTLRGPAGPFLLEATADRIDERGGALHIIDYKTGTPPTATEVRAGFAPQLPLEAVIAAAGGFPNVPALRIGSIAFWHLHGRDDGGKLVELKGDLAALTDDARAGLEKLIAAFDRAETAYEARPHSAFAPKYSDYEHLARIKEWTAVEGGDD